MPDLILIPTYFRPEYLHLCLEHIAGAVGGPEKQVWIVHDRHIGKETDAQLAQLAEAKEIANHFGQCFAKLEFIERRPHSCVGNVYNALEAYREAYEQSQSDLIYFIEDDVFVGPDFFRWHEAVQQRSDYFCTVGWHCIRNPEVKPSTDHLAYIETSRDFSSIGVCWKRASLAPIVRHAVCAYYMHHPKYLRQHFPDSPIPAGQWTEQAGLIMRVLLEGKDSRVIAWPEVSRCAHVGINGYHRPRGFKFTGPLDQRIDGLREAAKSTERIISLSKDPFDDVQSLPAVPPWTADQLYVSQRFKWNGKL